jgi:hypothetical protein
LPRPISDLSPTSSSRVTGITGVYYHTQLLSLFEIDFFNLSRQ